jgi:hypothetical protein
MRPTSLWTATTTGVMLFIWPQDRWGYSYQENVSHA